MERDFTIGKLAVAAGVNVETIRYYQRRGLLEEPPKPSDGYRLYPAETVRRVHFIKRAQALGFTLTEIAGLLSLGDTDSCAETRKLAARKLVLIENKINDLTAMRQTLSNLARNTGKTFFVAWAAVIPNYSFIPASFESIRGPPTDWPGSAQTQPSILLTTLRLRV